MSNFENWGHFTQLVWQATTSVGCASHPCSSVVVDGQTYTNTQFTVCNYSPAGTYILFVYISRKLTCVLMNFAGNYAGQYDKNVAAFTC
jgi:Cysteine-rich secretory protein family